MDILLPDRIDGLPAQLLDDVRQITLIGANGSGKTRFAHAKSDISIVLKSKRAISNKIQLIAQYAKP